MNGRVFDFLKKHPHVPDSPAIYEFYHLYPLMVEENDDFIFFLTPQGTFQYVNQTMADSLDYDRDSMLDKHCFDFIHEEDIPKMTFHLEKYMENRPSYEIELRFRKKSGTIFPSLIRAKILFNEHGEVTGTVCTGRRLSETLVDYSDLYQKLPFERRIMANLPGVIWTCDQNLKTIYVSPTSTHILGFTPDEILSNPNFWNENIHPDDVEKVTIAWDLLYKENAPYDIEYRFYHKKGKQIWVKDKSFGFYERHGTWYSDGILLDITKMKRIQTDLAQAQKMDALGRFAGGIAHDFNNLLTIIQGFGEMLVNPNISHQDRILYTEEIKNATQRAVGLTQQINTFSRKTKHHPSGLNINIELKKSDKIHQQIFPTSVSFEKNLAQDLGDIWMDANQLNQIISNLLWNAKDAIEENGTVTIITRNESITVPLAAYGNIIPPGNYITLTIKDTGIGIPSHNLAKIFEPFYTSKFAGNGLGLAIVHSIITQNDAYISVESEHLKGTEFKIYFPRYNEIINSKTIEQQNSSKTIRKYNFQKQLVILAENEEGIRKYLELGLQTHNFKVIATSNGKDALQMLKKNAKKVKYLISDIKMPKMNGITLANEVHALNPKVKIILISGYTHDYLKTELTPIKNYKFVPKPINLVNILDVIQDWQH